jgi:hypothetical protein
VSKPRRLLLLPRATPGQARNLVRPWVAEPQLPPYRDDSPRLPAWRRCPKHPTRTRRRLP